MVQKLAPIPTPLSPQLGDPIQTSLLVASSNPRPPIRLSSPSLPESQATLTRSPSPLMALDAQTLSPATRQLMEKSTPFLNSGRS